jgi:hypothetical protein
MNNPKPFEYVFTQLTPEKFAGIFDRESPQTNAFILSFAEDEEYVKAVLSSYDDYFAALVKKGMTHIDGNFDWYGNIAYKQNKGVGVFLFDDYRFTCFPECYRGEFKYVLPFGIEKEKNLSFTLFAVWAKKYVDNNGGFGDHDTPYYYSQQVIKAMEHYCIYGPSIVIGDYNTFSTLENKRLAEFEEAIKPFCDLNNSAGEKKHEPTFFSAKDGTGTDDFCYATTDIDVKNFTIGKKEDFIDTNLSDHCPIIVDFDI